MKKFLGIVLILALVMSLSASAFAATITINQPTPTDGTAGAETYVAYKIFDVTKTSSVTEDVTIDATLGAGTATGFAYTISSSNAWYSVVNGMTDYFTLTQSAGNSTVYNVTLKDGKNTAEAAKEIASYLEQHIPTSVECNPTATGYNAEAAAAATTKMYTFTSNGSTATVSTDDGYYMITSTLGTNLVAATSNITINTKNEYITDTKTAETSHYNVGDHVPYTITVNLPASIDYTKPVIVHDTMDNVLKLDEGSVAAKVGTDTFSGITLVTSNNFSTFYVNPKAAHNNTDHPAAEGKVIYDFYLDISSLAPAAGSEPVAKTITITYTAELLSTALADTGYINKEFVEYSKYKTTPNDVTVKTYDFDLEKTFTGSTDTTLEATFNLYPAVTTPPAEEGGTATTSKGSTPIQFVEETKYEKYVKADSDDATTTATTTATITAKLGTTLNVRGLDAGTYYLTELTTADGYNLLTEDIVVVIDENGNATVQGTSDLFSASRNKITVVNNTGTVLPSTGGIGTTIFYVIGGILVVGAGIVLVARKKSRDD